jgi:hypothetical protein
MTLDETVLEKWGSFLKERYSRAGPCRGKERGGKPLSASRAEFRCGSFRRDAGIVGEW